MTVVAVPETRTKCLQGGVSVDDLGSPLGNEGCIRDSLSSCEMCGAAVTMTAQGTVGEVAT